MALYAIFTKKQVKRGIFQGLAAVFSLNGIGCGGMSQKEVSDKLPYFSWVWAQEK